MGYDMHFILSIICLYKSAVRWNLRKASAKDRRYFVSAYASVLEDCIWEKAFQASHTFSVI